MSSSRVLASVLVFLLLAQPQTTAWSLPMADIPLTYIVQEPTDGPRGELDSVALWVSPNGTQSLLFITDKLLDVVEVHDVITNTYVGRIGGSGSGPGQMARPNGVAVAHDMPTYLGPRDILLVVERDNDRVSAWLLPWLYPLGTFGDGATLTPYGVTTHVDNGIMQAWVTSTGYSPQRVMVYDLSWESGTDFVGTLNRSFEVPGDAVLESIVIDPVHQRAIVCDEGNFNIMAYSMAGSLLTRFGVGVFVDDPEGVDIYDTGNGTGYIVIPDQNSVPMQFEVFDRVSFDYMGSFSGPTAGTDGLVLTQRPLPNLPNGAMFAVHNDSTVHVYDWADIAAGMGLCVNECSTSDAASDPVPRRTTLLTGQPNPFNPATSIRFALDRPGRTVLRIYDLQGRLVRHLLDRQLPAGEHQVPWRGTDDAGRSLAAGVYFVQLESGEARSRAKVTLVK